MYKEDMPHIAFCPLPRSGKNLIAGGPLQALLPLARDGSYDVGGGEITYEDYLEAVRRAILIHWRSFRIALAKRGAQSGVRVERIEIRCEKHGSDYHPARIRAFTTSGGYSFVMNVALTDRGRARLPGEFRTLRYLGRRPAQSFVPKVYFMCSERCGAREDRNPGPTMFLAEWLEGYHEFHLTRTGEGDATTVVLWDRDRGHRAVSERDTAEIFKQAAFVLTTCYDVRTFREVFPWHHASGDFVVNRHGGKIRVKLISARHYTPRVLFKRDSPDNAKTALLVFFVNLTLRMRLDRIDGIGDVGWAHVRCLEASIMGFLDALRCKAEQEPCCRTLFNEFGRTMQKISPAELADHFSVVVDAYDGDAPDVPVIRENLAEHVFEVYKALQNPMLFTRNSHAQ